MDAKHLSVVERAAEYYAQRANRRPDGSEPVFRLFSRGASHADIVQAVQEVWATLRAAVIQKR